VGRRPQRHRVMIALGSPRGLAQIAAIRRIVARTPTLRSLRVAHSVGFGVGTTSPFRIQPRRRANGLRRQIRLSWDAAAPESAPKMIRLLARHPKRCPLCDVALLASRTKHARLEPDHLECLNCGLARKHAALDLRMKRTNKAVATYTKGVETPG